MKRKITFELSEEVFQAFEKSLEEANRDFTAGRIYPSALVSEMILQAKVDYEELRSKNVDLRKYLRLLADQESIDIASIYASVKKLKGRTSRTKTEDQPDEEV